MKIGVWGDAHGNLISLKNIIDDMNKHRVDLCVTLGSNIFNEPEYVMAGKGESGDANVKYHGRICPSWVVLNSKGDTLCDHIACVAKGGAGGVVSNNVFILNLNDKNISDIRLKITLQSPAWRTAAFRIVICEKPEFLSWFRDSRFKMVEDHGVDLYISNSFSAYVRGTTRKGIPYVITGGTSDSQMATLWDRVRMWLIGGKKWVRYVPNYGIITPMDESLEVIFYGVGPRVGVLDGFHLQKKD